MISRSTSSPPHTQRLARAAAAAGLALALGGLTAAHGQSGAPGPSTPPAASAAGAETGTSPVPRSDLTGTWDRYHPTGLKLDPRFTSSIRVSTDPPLKPKYLAAWKARQAASRAADQRGQPLFSGYAQCIPDGMPAMMMAMFPMDVLQTPGQITIIEEAYRQVRYIYLDQKQVAIEDAEPEFWGHSVGHWMGDTLRVNTVGIRPEVRFQDVPHSNLLQIDERIRLVSPDRFEDRITLIDPVYLTKPWTFTWQYQRRAGYKMLEYVCESNREVDKNGAQSLQLLDLSGDDKAH
jgi:hypothetical protein